jgi:hypothetical protein
MELPDRLSVVAPACLGAALSPHVFLLEKQDIRLVLTADLTRRAATAASSRNAASSPGSRPANRLAVAPGW